MSKKWKISLFSLLFVLLIFVVTACDNKSGGNQEPEWGEWVVTKAATCTEEGVETRTAKNDSTKTETRAIQKKEHTPGQAVKENVKVATCTVDGSYDEVVYCTKCETKLSTKHYTEDHTGHDYHDHSVAATCEHAETITYTCENCGDHYDVTGSPKLQHQFGTNEQEEIYTPVQGENCKFKVETVCKCNTCNKNIVLITNYVTSHEYVASVTKEATCTQAGKVTYTCSHDGDHYDVDLGINPNAHTWVAGTPDPTTGITIHTCSQCNATKSTFSAKDQVAPKISNAIIQEATEIELKNATIAFDEDAKEVLGTSGDVTISAATVDTSSLDLDAKTMERIGDNTVFDFTCQVGDNTVSNFGTGTVKVTIPYTLAEGEDPNRIAIWYLAENGETQQMDAVYSNGFVTFETSHFSKYVVVKLTPQELCEKFNLHDMVFVKSSDPSCTEYGQILYACSRCGKVEIELTPMIDHDFDIDHEHSLAPTYDAEGYTEYACRNCDATMRVVIPKKPRPADNRIQNLINSLFEEDYFISVDGLEKLANVTMANSQIKLTEDGNIYMISRAVNQETGEEMISIVDMNNGLAYNISESGYSISTASMNFDLNMIKKTVYAVTELIPTDLGNKVLDKVLPILFDVETTDTEVTLTFNTEKLVTLYDNLLNKTIGQNVDILIGEGTTDVLTTLVDGALDMTVNQLMTLLEGMGITVDTVADLVKQIPGTELFNADTINGFITLAGNMKVLDVINLVIPMIQEMMKEKMEDVPQVSPIIPQGITLTETEEPVDGDTEAETEEETEEETTFVPITKKQIMDGLTGILAMKVTDLVAKFVPNAEAMLANLPTKDYLKALTTDLLDLKVTLNNKYQFKKLEAEVKFNAAIKQMIKSIPANMDIDITAVIEHQNKEDLFDVQQKIKEAKDNVVLLDITLDSHDWFVAEVNDYLDTTDNNSNNLTYTFTKQSYQGEQYYEIKSSKFDVAYNNGTEEATIKAYYSIMLYSYGEYKYISKDENGNYYKYINSSAAIVYVLPDGQEYRDSIYIPGTAYYNPTTKKYSLGSNGGSDVGLYTYEIITYEEYIQQTHYSSSKQDNYVYFKRTNVATGKVYYSSASIGGRVSQVVYVLNDTEFKANAEQKTTQYGAKVNYYYGIESYVVYYEVTANGLQYNGIQANYQPRFVTFANGLRANYGDYDNEKVTQNVNLETFKVQFLTTEVVDACCSKAKIKISVDGTNYTELTGYVYNHQGESTTTHTKTGCIVHYETKCSTCNRVISSWTSTEHNYTYRYLVEAHDTMPGVYVRICPDCGYQDEPEEYYCYHRDHTPHLNNDGEIEYYECNACHFTWKGYEYPVIFLKQIPGENEYNIRYQLFDYKNFDDFRHSYQVSLFVAYLGADGEEVMARLEVQYAYCDVTYYETDDREFRYNYLSYEGDEVAEALASLNITGEYTLYVVVSNDNGYMYTVELD